MSTGRNPGGRPRKGVNISATPQAVPINRNINVSADLRRTSTLHAHPTKRTKVTEGFNTEDDLTTWSPDASLPVNDFDNGLGEIPQIPENPILGAKRRRYDGSVSF